MKQSKNRLFDELIETISSIKGKEKLARFMKDLCTPQEIKAVTERWQVCKLLNEGELSYREISKQTGVSLATITRVARFLKDEPHHGYKYALKNLEKTKSG